MGKTEIFNFFDIFREFYQGKHLGKQISIKSVSKK